MDSADAGERCLWTELTPPVPAPVVALPSRTGVVVVGGGYTGLAAARALARAGRDVTVIEREVTGWGASGRNGGFVLPGFKADLPEIAARYGTATAQGLFQLSLDAVNFVEQLVRDENIACDFHRPGWISLAARPAHQAAFAESARLLGALCGYQTTVLDAAAVRQEIGSSRFFGGWLDPGAAAVQPAAYVNGLAVAARRAGASVVERTSVQAISGRQGAFRVETSQGPVAAEQVLVATDGYGGREMPALLRRVVPVGSYIIATPPLEESVARRLIPRGRVLSDTRRLLNYFRLSPDRRLVFGGRARFVPGRLAGSAELLVSQMQEVFPELSGTPIEYAWGGHLGFTRDGLPHVGLIDGIHYAVGYCGHGVALASWLGHRMGEALAGSRPMPELPGKGFGSIPGYYGTPWFLPLVGAWYRFRDALD
ncbi:MAG: NAD(P)/FAD-dependent oxidoreductase [Gemmatimonadales bacterium]